MDGRIDPPSSFHRMTLATLADTAHAAELWAIGDPAIATVTLTARADFLYIGKLCTSAHHRHLGFARQLVDLASDRARALNLPALQLQTRIELTENHAIFARLGFREVARTAHPGFDRPTSITMRRTLSP